MNTRSNNEAVWHFRPSIKNLLSLSCYALFILLPLGQLERLSLTPTIAIYLHDLAIFLLIILWGIYRVQVKTKRNKAPFERPILFFILIAAVSLVFNLPVYRENSLSGLLYLLRFCLILPLYPIIYDLIKAKILTIKQDNVFIALITAFIVGGLIQYLFIPDLRFLYALGWDDHLNRLAGTILDPGFMGCILLLGLIYSEHRHFTLLSTFSFVTLMLTYSRGSYLALLIWLLWEAIRQRSIRFLLSWVAIFLSAVILLPAKGGGEGVNLTRQQSIVQRNQSNQSALTTFATHPILGIGFNNYRQVINNNGRLDRQLHVSSPDNSYLFILVTTGLIGIIVFLQLIRQLLVWSWRHSPILLSSLIAVGVHALTANSLFYVFILIWLMMLLAFETAKH